MSSLRRSHVLVGVALLVAALGVFFLVRALTGGGSIAAPAPSPTPTQTPEPAPTPQAKAFAVKLVAARGAALENSNMFKRPPPERPRVVKGAATAAAGRLERYLNRQFVNPKTRFSNAPVRELLTQKAFAGLSRSDRAGLGVAKLQVAGGRKGAARVRAVVLHQGTTAHAVTLRYRAKIKLILHEKPQALVQEGTIVFAPAKRGWRADMVDVRLSLPQPPKKKPEPAAEPSEARTS